MLTVKQVAARLNISASSVYALVTSERLPALRIGPRGGAIRIRPEDIDVYLASCQVEPILPALPERRIRLRHLRV